MAGLFSQGLGALAKKGMKIFQEQIWPIAKYLIEHRIFIPVLGIAAIAGGVCYKFVSGNTGAWCIVIIVGLVLATRMFKKKGESQ